LIGRESIYFLISLYVFLKNINKCTRKDGFTERFKILAGYRSEK